MDTTDTMDTIDETDTTDTIDTIDETDTIIIVYFIDKFIKDTLRRESFKREDWGLGSVGREEALGRAIKKIKEEMEKKPKSHSRRYVINDNTKFVAENCFYYVLALPPGEFIKGSETVKNVTAKTVSSDMINFLNKEFDLDIKGLCIEDDDSEEIREEKRKKLNEIVSTILDVCYKKKEVEKEELVSAIQKCINTVEDSERTGEEVSEEVKKSDDIAPLDDDNEEEDKYVITVDTKGLKIASIFAVLIIVGCFIYTEILYNPNENNMERPLIEAEGGETPKELLEEPEWNTYKNDTYHYMIDIPSTFKKSKYSSPDDITYTALDGKATLSIKSTFYDEEIPSEYLMNTFIKRFDNNYDMDVFGDLEKEGWYAATIKLDSVYKYRKCIITSENTIACFDISFPSSQGSIYAEYYYTDHIENSFRIYRH